MKTISGILIILVLEMTLPALGSPFLYNAAPLFLQSIFRLSSGIPDNGTQHVEDLRNNDEPSKLEHLQAERKHFARQQTEDNPSNSNEAVPNFFQKKIEKILYKLRLISQLSGPFNFGGGQEHTNKEPDEFDFDFDSSDEKNDTDVSHTTVKMVTTRTTTAAATTKSDKIRPQRFSLILPRENAMRIETKPLDNDLSANVDNEGTANKVNPGAIGVFLVEMLGTVLTLIYGAAVQNNNENNTAPDLI